MKNSLRNRIGRAEPSLKNNASSLKKNASPIPTVDLSRRVKADPASNVREGLLTRIEIRLTRWSIILLAVIGIIYVTFQIRELFGPAKSISVTPQITSESEYHKKPDTKIQQPQAMTSPKPENARSELTQNTLVTTEQPGNLIDPEFSITPFEKDQSGRLRLCIVNKNPASTSTLSSGDIFEMIFPTEVGQINLVPDSIVVKSSIISRIDFQASIISNQVHLTYIGQNKRFPALDSCWSSPFLWIGS